MNRKYGDAMKREVLKQARKFQRNRPRASSAFALANALMVASNRVQHRRDKTGSFGDAFADANDLLLHSQTNRRG
jgi:hypothetical protein